ncbi:hypothetical protein ACFFQW_31980 [Umezawaea endophytica]|uniref:Uncharacterized protein n=1 Tax=Umezawaea endophytica TaxID=1654476 RepID=A0A9X2VSE3_9PSEU|nr:hypothetical protein [Umezawaea endophytica]MCS7480683.1 hypothetical protein [Umezawaea endophytica]
MASKMSWRHYLADSVPVTVYWFSEERDWRTGRVRKALGDSVSRHPVEPSATEAETAEWSAAAAAYVDEVAAAARELGLAERRTSKWRGAPLTRRWAKAKFDEAVTSFVDRVGAATARYQPVREAIDARLVEQEATRLREAEQERKEQARAWRLAEGRFLAWSRRHAAADLEVVDGRTPRQLAAEDAAPAEWPPEVVAAVGDVDEWWAGLRESAVNRHARATAVRTVVEAVTATTAALERAGRPGIEVVEGEPSATLDGWWVEFSWPDLPGVQRLSRPPDIPVDHLWQGDWWYDLYLYDRLALTPTWRGDYVFATPTSTEIGNGVARRHSWLTWTVAEFADNLFPDRVTYRQRYHYDGKDVGIPMTDYADPAIFLPYVDAVTRHAVTVFRALAPD